MKKIFSFFRRKGSNIPTPQTAMNVPDFVHASLVGIISGIQKAQKEYEGGNSAFCPLISPAWGPPLSEVGGGAKGHADKIFEIEFDIAVTVTTNSSAKSRRKGRITRHRRIRRGA